MKLIDELHSVDPEFERSLNAFLNRPNRGHSSPLMEVTKSKAIGDAACSVVEIVSRYSVPWRHLIEEVEMMLNDPDVTKSVHEGGRLLAQGLIVAFLYGVWLGQSERATLPSVDA